MNVFELFAKLSLDKDDYDKKMGDAKSTAEKVGGAIGTGFKAAGAMALAGVGAATTGVAALTKAGVQAYASYEQMVGGVDTLFKEASSDVQQYAQNAWQTAGMDANRYMETATSFSASLINSLGGDTKAAADVADRAIRDMSDNANKMGTSMDSIIATYQSLSRGNFAMLDNLKLGYGGTKSEMEKLLADAASYTEEQEKLGITVEAGNMSFANMANAISVVQAHLGIAGATAAEAATTIEGSANATKAAWQNLITAIAGGGDIGQAFENLKIALFGANEGEGLVNQVIPRIQQTMEGIGNFIVQGAPLIADKLPALVDAILPGLLQAGGSLFAAFAEAAPELLSSVWSAIEQAFTLGFQALGIDITPLLDNIDGALSTVGDLIGSIDLSGVADLLNTIIPYLDEAAIIIGSIAAAVEIYNAVQLVATTVTAAKAAADAAGATSLWAYAAAQAAALAPAIAIVAAIAAVIAIIVLCITHWDAIKAKTQEVVGFIADWASQKFQEFKNKVAEIFNNIKQFFIDVWAAIKESAFGDFIDFIEKIFIAYITTYIAVIKAIFEALKNFFVTIWEGIKAVFAFFTDQFLPAAQAKFQSFKDKVVDIFQKLKDGIKSIWDGITNTIKSAINSILGFINGLIRGVVNGVNKIFDALNKIQVEVPAALQGLVGMESFGFNFEHITAPQIPLLARGGVIARAGQAIVGEAGAELVDLPAGAQVTPLNGNNSDFMNMLREILELIRDWPKDTPVILDSGELVGALAPGMDANLGQAARLRERGI